jgi:hypothetical protein
MAVELCIQGRFPKCATQSGTFSDTAREAPGVSAITNVQAGTLDFGWVQRVPHQRLLQKRKITPAPPSRLLIPVHSIGGHSSNSFSADSLNFMRKNPCSSGTYYSNSKELRLGRTLKRGLQTFCTGSKGASNVPEEGDDCSEDGQSVVLSGGTQQFVLHRLMQNDGVSVTYAKVSTAQSPARKTKCTNFLETGVRPLS